MVALPKKVAPPRLGPTRSALVRQKGLPGQNLKSVEGQVKKARGAGKGAAAKELAQAKKAVPVHKQAIKDVAGLKKVAAAKQHAGLKPATPARSALVRPKGLPGQNLKSLEGQLQKAHGAGKGAAGKELGQAKKAAIPGRRAVTKVPGFNKVAGLKKAAGLNKAAGLKKAPALKGSAQLKKPPALKGAASKALAPKRSALLRQKNVLGQLGPGGAKAGKATIGKDMGGIKKALSQSKAAQPANKVGALDKKIQRLNKPRGLGRILGTRSQTAR